MDENYYLLGTIDPRRVGIIIRVIRKEDLNEKYPDQLIDLTGTYHFTETKDGEYSMNLQDHPAGKPTTKDYTPLLELEGLELKLLEQTNFHLIKISKEKADEFLKKGPRDWGDL